MEMVMIPKPGRDTWKVKGWRPIFLLNTVSKLADKLVRRKGRRAIDSVMDELRRESDGEVYGRNIKSAFNSLDRDILYEIGSQYEDLREWVDYFLRPRTFNNKVDGKLRW